MITDSESVLRDELGRIAPEINIDDIDPTADLRDEFDIDSMDFLNLITALGERLNRAMPESDYTKMSTFESLVAYLNGDTNS